MSENDGRSCAVDAFCDNEAAAVCSDLASAGGLAVAVAFELSTLGASISFLSCFETSAVVAFSVATGDDFGLDLFVGFVVFDVSLLGVFWGASLLDGTLKEALLGLPADGVSDIAISPTCG